MLKIIKSKLGSEDVLVYMHKEGVDNPVDNKIQKSIRSFWQSRRAFGKT